MAINQNPQDLMKNSQPISLNAIFTKSSADILKEQEEALRLKEDAGYVQGRVGKSYDQEEQQEEQARKDTDAAFQSAVFEMERDAQETTFRGVKMHYKSFVANLVADTQLDKAMKNINSGFVEVNRDDMLHVDANGKRIDAKDDPDDKFLVRTKEQKKAYEDRAGLDTKFLALDEVTKLDNGKLVRKDAFDDNQRLDSKITEQSTLFDQLQSGEKKLDDVDDHIKERIADRISGNEPKPILVGDAEKLRQDMERDRLGTEFKLVLEGKLDPSTLSPDDQLKMKEMEKIREDQAFKVGLTNGVAELANSALKPDMTFTPKSTLGM